jgi:hypothetical protein
VAVHGFLAGLGSRIIVRGAWGSQDKNREGRSFRGPCCYQLRIIKRCRFRGACENVRKLAVFQFVITIVLVSVALHGFYRIVFDMTSYGAVLYGREPTKVLHLEAATPTSFGAALTKPMKIDNQFDIARRGGVLLDDDIPEKVGRSVPKFHGACSKLEGPLKAVLAWCQNPGSPNPASIEVLTQKAETADAMMAALSAVGYQFPYTAERVQRMLRDLYTEGFTAFG